MNTMLGSQQNSIDSHRRFIKRVSESRVVWGLRSKVGWAAAPSNDHDGKEVMPFWSDRAYAARAAKDEWADYEPTSIDLDSFIDKWLRGMNKDNLLVGTNWNAHLMGLEVEPAELARELLEATSQRRLTVKIMAKL
jgi:hypothetical protein